MALVAIDRRLPFEPPWAGGEEWRALFPGPVLRSAEEPLCDIVMRGGVRPTLDRRLGILAIPMDPTPANGAMFGHTGLHFGEERTKDSPSSPSYDAFWGLGSARSVRMDDWIVGG